jgi:hypothetical protein
MEIFYRKDAETSFTSLGTITTTKYGTGYQRAVLNCKQDFFRIQLKCVLTGTTTETPELFNLRFNFDERENEL